MTYKDLLVCLQLEQISAQYMFKKMFEQKCSGVDLHV